MVITNSKRLFDNHKNMPNLIYFDDTNSDVLEAINMYSEVGDYLVVHGFPYYCRYTKLSKTCLKKIVWRTWGHDIMPVFYYFDVNKPLSNLKFLFSKHIKEHIKEYKYYYGWKHIVKNFNTIGIGSFVDEYSCNSFFGKKNYVDMPYLDNKQVDILKKYSLECKENDGYFNIMVGHSGYNDNHYNMINKLKHFENNKVRLHFVLSYG